ncbi:hypothetical protein JHK86_000760 [Glycine max]|nr:hypothetical protein JHK86_000760 [Glycine max]
MSAVAGSYGYIAPEALVIFLKIALFCTSTSLLNRPTMREVIAMLIDAREYVSKSPTSPTSESPLDEDDDISSKDEVIIEACFGVCINWGVVELVEGWGYPICDRQRREVEYTTTVFGTIKQKDLEKEGSSPKAADDLLTKDDQEPEKIKVPTDGNLVPKKEWDKKKEIMTSPKVIIPFP